MRFAFVFLGIYADGAKINLDSLRFAEVDKRIKHNYCKWKCPSFLRRVVSFVLSFQVIFFEHIEGNSTPCQRRPDFKIQIRKQ